MAHSTEIEKLERRWMDNPLGVTFAPLAEAYRRAGEHPRALEVLEVGLTQHPAYVPALIVQARCHLDTGLMGAAEASFHDVLQSDPHNLIALKGLADICEQGMRPAEAQQFLERLLEADPTHDDARSQMIRVVAVQTRPSPEIPLATEAEPLGGGFEPAAPEPGLTDLRDDVPSEPGHDSAVQISPAAESFDAAEPGMAGEVAEDLAEDPLGLSIEREASPFEELSAGGWSGQSFSFAAPDQPFEEESVPGQSPPPSAESEHTAILDQEMESRVDAPVADSGPEAPIETGWGWDVPVDSARQPSAFADGDSELRPAPPPDDKPDWLPWTSVDTAAPTETEPSGSGSSAIAEEEVEPTAPEGFTSGGMDELIPSEGTVFGDGGDAGDDPWPEAETENSVPAALSFQPESTPSAVTDTPVEVWADSGAGDRVESDPIVESASESIPEPINPSPAPEPWAAWDEPVPLADSGSEPAMGEAFEAVAEPERSLDRADEWMPEPNLDVAAPAAVADTDDAPVTVPDGAEAEAGQDGMESPLEIEPELVITETMAEVFLRQGHRPLALAVYAQLVERDPANARLVAAFARLKSELEPPSPAPLAGAPELAAPYGAAETGGESVGAFLARVLSAEPPRSAAAIHPPAIEPASAGAPTRPAADSLSLNAIFGDDPVRAGAVTLPAGAEQDGESEPTFDEFFAGGRSLLDQPSGPGLGGEEDLEQFNAWLRGLKR